MLALQIAELLSISLLECNELGEFMSKKIDLHGLWDPSNFESSACQEASHSSLLGRDLWVLPLLAVGRHSTPI